MNIIVQNKCWKIHVLMILEVLGLKYQLGLQFSGIHQQIKCEKFILNVAKCLSNNDVV